MTTCQTTPLRRLRLSEPCRSHCFTSLASSPVLYSTRSDSRQVAYRDWSVSSSRPLPSTSTPSALSAVYCRWSRCLSPAPSKSGSSSSLKCVPSCACQGQPLMRCAQGVLFGIVVGFGIYPALAVVGQYFKARRALAMGIVAAGSSVGGVCLPIMFSRLFKTIGFGRSIKGHSSFISV